MPELKWTEREKNIVDENKCQTHTLWNRSQTHLFMVCHTVSQNDGKNNANEYTAVERRRRRTKNSYTKIEKPNFPTKPTHWHLDILDKCTYWAQYKSFFSFKRWTKKNLRELWISKPNIILCIEPSNRFSVCAVAEYSCFVFDFFFWIQFGVFLVFFILALILFPLFSILLLLLFHSYCIQCMRCAFCYHLCANSRSFYTMMMSFIHSIFYCTTKQFFSQ